MQDFPTLKEEGFAGFPDAEGRELRADKIINYVCTAEEQDHRSILKKDRGSAFGKKFSIALRGGAGAEGRIYKSPARAREKKTGGFLPGALHKRKRQSKGFVFLQKNPMGKAVQIS